jgi:hypothetical protein
MEREEPETYVDPLMISSSVSTNTMQSARILAVSVADLRATVQR